MMEMRIDMIITSSFFPLERGYNNEGFFTQRKQQRHGALMGKGGYKFPIRAYI